MFAKNDESRESNEAAKDAPEWQVAEKMRTSPVAKHQSDKHWAEWATVEWVKAATNLH